MLLSVCLGAFQHFGILKCGFPFIRDVIQNYPSPKNEETSTPFWYLLSYICQNDKSVYFMAKMSLEIICSTSLLKCSNLCGRIFINSDNNIKQVFIEHLLYARWYAKLIQSSSNPVRLLITNPISQMIRMRLPINEHSIDFFCRYESLKAMNKSPNTKSLEIYFSLIPQLNNNFYVFNPQKISS